MASNLPIPVQMPPQWARRDFGHPAGPSYAYVYSCSCGLHCSPRCPHLDFDLTSDGVDTVAWCDLFVCSLEREPRRQPMDPILMVKRHPKCLGPSNR